MSDLHRILNFNNGESSGYRSSPDSQNLSSPGRPVSPTSSMMRRRVSLLDFPRHILGRIAFHLVVDDQGIGRHPSGLLDFTLTCRTVNNAISFDEYPKLYHDLFCATFDYLALVRRFDWMASNASKNNKQPKEKKLFKLFDDPRSWAIDYKSRWEMSRRMKRVVEHNGINVPGVCDKEQLKGDLWNIWFSLTENDGKNLDFLLQHCRYKEWIGVWYKDVMLPDALVPGYPKDTGEKCLGLWCALLSGGDTPSPQESLAKWDEHWFVFRPYVFACAKYDITYAPWQRRVLPLCEPNCSDHEPDVTMQSKALPYKRFGYTWRRAPPNFVLGAYLLFFRLLERHPDRVKMVPGSTGFNQLPGDVNQPGVFSGPRIMPSIYHDREWQRNSVCQDPHTSPGLPPLSFHGELEGYWRGKFLFYDFDMYRSILAGDIRTVYTGHFAEQAVELEFKETVIKVRKEEVGGSGPLLCAGFRGEEGNQAEEQARVEAGYGYAIAQPEEPDEEGWTKEILLSGRCRSSWGWASVRGRVRAWDGLVILSISYSNAASRWLWRGYLHTGGNLIGRWRDTFSAEHLRGYEGAFGLVRAGDLLWPSHYPMTMSQSLGVQNAPINNSNTAMNLNAGTVHVAPGPIAVDGEVDTGTEAMETDNIQTTTAGSSDPLPQTNTASASHYAASSDIEMTQEPNVPHASEAGIESAPGHLGREGLPLRVDMNIVIGRNGSISSASSAPSGSTAASSAHSPPVSFDEHRVPQHEMDLRRKMDTL